MTVQITSTTDSADAVTAAMANASTETAKDETKSAAEAEASAETPAEESETSEEKVETETEEAEASEESEDAEESESKPEEGKPRNRSGFKKRIDKLTRKLTAKEQELEYWRTEAMKSKPKEEPAQPTQVKPETSSKPKSEDFESHEEYVEALTDWKLDQKLNAERAKTKEEQVKTDFQSRVEKHVERVESFAAKHDDFHDLMEDVDDIPMSVTVQEVILASENGPELMYELAKNREEYKRICSLPALEAARELGRFEIRIAKPESKDETKEIKQTKQTKAPPPIKPVGSKSAGAVSKSIYDADLSQHEFERLRKEQLAKRA